MISKYILPLIFLLSSSLVFARKPKVKSVSFNDSSLGKEVVVNLSIVDKRAIIIIGYDKAMDTKRSKGSYIVKKVFISKQVNRLRYIGSKIKNEEVFGKVSISINGKTISDTSKYYRKAYRALRSLIREKRIKPKGKNNESHNISKRSSSNSLWSSENGITRSLVLFK